MELKYKVFERAESVTRSSNCTFMELKSLQKYKEIQNSNEF